MSEVKKITRPSEAPAGWVIWRNTRTGEMIAGLPSARELAVYRVRNCEDARDWQQVSRPTMKVRPS